MQLLISALLFASGAGGPGVPGEEGQWNVRGAWVVVVDDSPLARSHLTEVNATLNALRINACEANLRLKLLDSTGKLESLSCEQPFEWSPSQGHDCKLVKDILLVRTPGRGLVVIVHPGPAPASATILKLEHRPIDDPVRVIAIREPDDRCRRIAAALSTVCEKPPAVPPRHAPRRDPFDDVVAVGNDAAFNCSGVIVSAHAVLTARHCLPATRIGLGRTFDRLSQARVESISLPPGLLDAALLRVGQELGPKPHPRRVAADPEPSLFHVGGFGARDPEGRFGSGVLRFFDAAGGFGCSPASAVALGCSATQEMVLRPAAGHDTCDGDSGGPVYERRFAGGQVRWALAAITSRPVANAVARCGSGGVYVRVDALEPWLGSTLDEWSNPTEEEQGP